MMTGATERAMLWHSGSKKDRNRTVEPELAEWFTTEVKNTSDTYNQARLAGVIIEDAAENHSLARVERRLDKDLEQYGIDPSALEPSRASRKWAHTQTEDESGSGLLREYDYEAKRDEGELYEINLSLPERLCNVMRGSAPSPRSQSKWFNHALVLFRNSPYSCRMERISTKEQILEYVEEGELPAEPTRWATSIVNPPDDAPAWLHYAHSEVEDADPHAAVVPGQNSVESKAEELERRAEAGEDIEAEEIGVIKGERGIDRALVVYQALPPEATTRKDVQKFVRNYTEYGANAARDLARSVVEQFDLGVSTDETSDVDSQKLAEDINELMNEAPSRSALDSVVRAELDVVKKESKVSSGSNIDLAATIDSESVEELVEFRDALRSEFR